MKRKQTFCRENTRYCFKSSMHMINDSFKFLLKSETRGKKSLSYFTNLAFTHNLEVWQTC